MFKRIFSVCFILVTVIFLQGCVMTTVPFESASLQPDKALVYIYRPESIISRGVHFRVIINDNETLVPFINNGYFPVYVTPGSVKFVLQENSLIKGTLDTQVFNIEAGKEYYIKANPAIFGAYKLIMMENDIGKAEVSETDFYQDKE